MSLYEYQAKEYLRGFGVPVPRGICCLTPDDAVSVASSLGGNAWLIKPQTIQQPPPSRNAFRIARTLREVRRFSLELLGDERAHRNYQNHERMVRCLLIEEVVRVNQAFFVALTRERWTQAPTLIVATADRTLQKRGTLPSHFIVERIDSTTGLSTALASELATEIGIPMRSLPQAIATLKGFYGCYLKTDVLHASIDPLVLGSDGSITAIDVHFDASAAGADFIHDILLNRQHASPKAMPIAS